VGAQDRAAGADAEDNKAGKWVEGDRRDEVVHPPPKAALQEAPGRAGRHHQKHGALSPKTRLHQGALPRRRVRHRQRQTEGQQNQGNQRLDGTNQPHQPKKKGILQQNHQHQKPGQRTQQRNQPARKRELQHSNQRLRCAKQILQRKNQHQQFVLQNQTVPRRQQNDRGFRK